MTCKARQQNDQMCCGRCGQAWDINDPDPPSCKTDEQIKHECLEQSHKTAMAKIKQILGVEECTSKKS